MSFIISLILTLLLLAFGSAVAAHLFRKYRNMTNRYLDYLPRHVWNSISLQKLIGSPIPLPPPTGWAADSDILVELSRIVALSKPKIVVEVGSGLSTMVIAALLRDNGSGHLISIDHDADYAKATFQSLELARLESHVEMLVAPLRKQPLSNCEAGWYDLSSASIPETINLVFIDGPPAALDRNIREPALDFFWPRLAKHGHIVFDDADRNAETAFIDRWLSRHPDASVRRPVTLKGCAIISKLTP